MDFIKIPFIYSSANIRPNDMIAGMPAISAVAGMSHRVQCIFREDLGIPTFCTQGFSIVYYSIDRDLGTPRRPPQKQIKDVLEMPSLHDIRRAHGEAELIIAFTISEDSDYSEFSSLLRDRLGIVVESFNAGLRFAGGEVFIGTRGEFGSVDYSVSVVSDWSSALSQMMRAYPTRGQMIESKHQLLSEHAKKLQVTTLKALFDLCISSKREAYAPHTANSMESTPIKEENVTSLFDDLDTSFEDFDDGHAESEKEDELEQEYLGMLLPAATGFHEICEPRAEQYFVEPVLSLVRARILPSVKRDIIDGRADWKDHFWKWNFLPAHHLHYATNFNS